MTLPPHGHPQYELRRRIADCRERMRRSRTGQRTSEHEAHAQDTAAHDGETSDEAADAPARPGPSDTRRGHR